MAVVISEAERLLDTAKKILGKERLSAATCRLLVRVEILNSQKTDDQVLTETYPFDALFVGLFTATDPLSRWFQQYATDNGIDVHRILDAAGIPPARFARARAYKPNPNDVKRAFHLAFVKNSTAVWVLLAHASDLVKQTSGDSEQPVDLRHLLGTYLYRVKEYDRFYSPSEYGEEYPTSAPRAQRERIDFLARMTAWWVDREDLSAALLTFLAKRQPAEVPAWVEVHRAAFGNEPQLPHHGLEFVDPSERFETLFHDFRIKKRLGEGGAGTVYEVVDQYGRSYAIKRLNSKQSNSQKLDRFKREVEFCVETQHRGILKILDYGFRMIDGAKEPFYVMPLFSGTLRTLMKAGIPTRKAPSYFSQILSAVEFAHARKVWHRDLKPENVLYDKGNDLLVLADFGIAHFEEEALHAAPKTKKGEVLANFKYAAPEQRGSGRTIDQRVDIYALGLILNELFTGEVPQGTRYKTIGSVAPEFAPIDRTVSLMLRQDPAKRLATIADLRSHLDSNLQGFLAAARDHHASGSTAAGSTTAVEHTARVA